MRDTFICAQYFHQNLTDNHQLHAFALGAELPSVYTLISNNQDMMLNSLDMQRRLEKIAKQYYVHSIEKPRLKSVLCRYANSMMRPNTAMFHDVRVHAESPGLTLAKYYGALKKTNGHMDRPIVWESHLHWCRALSVALYEHYQDPRSDICYGKKTIIIDKPHERQCYSYTTIEKPVSFKLNRYQYRQLPWQWYD